MTDLDSTNITTPLWTLEARAAWVAASIDCDGWVSLNSSAHNDGYRRYYAKVGVTNQSYEYMEQFASFCGVPLRIGINGRIGRDDRLINTRKICYQATWASPKFVIPILELALPYLFIKRQRAEWVLEFCYSRMTLNGEVGRRFNPYTERVPELYRLLRKANSK